MRWLRPRILALLCLACVPVSCSKSSPPPPLAIRVAGDDWFLKSLEKSGMIAGYEAKTGERIEFLNRNDRTIMKDLDGAPGHSPYDLVVMRHRWMGTLIQKHEIQPIDSFLGDTTLHDGGFQPAQQLFPNWWRGLSWYGDKVYGYPYTGLTAFLCYRKDLLEDSENQRKFKARYHRALTVPANWKEYVQVAQFFTRPTDHFYGTYISGKQGLPLWYEWLNFAYSFGGDILDTQHGWEYGDIVVNSPQNVAATEQYVKLIAFSPPDTLTYGWDQAQAALQQQHAFMGLLWSDQAYLVEDAATSKVAGKIGYSLIPSNSRQKASQMEGLTWLIPAGTPNPKEAYRFLEWVMSDQVQVSQTLHGSNSTRESVYEDAKVKQMSYTAAFLGSVPIAKEKATLPESSPMIDAAERRLSEIVTGKETAKAGLDRLALDLQQILGSKAKLRYPVHGAQ
ncbi:MAG: extracellular solute-binding protein [Acidobacteriaceae bacterium]